MLGMIIKKEKVIIIIIIIIMVQKYTKVVCSLFQHLAATAKLIAGGPAARRGHSLSSELPWSQKLAMQQ